MRIQAFKKVFGIILVLSIMFSAIPTHSTMAASSVSLNATKLTIYVGNTKTLRLKNAPDSISWSSSDKSIATVNKNGVVTGLKSGKATITSISHSKKYKATVTVKSCKVSPTNIVITNGNGYQLSISSTKAKITWTSSDSSIVKVNSNGYASARGIGTAIIEGRVKKETYKCTITVVGALSNDDFKFIEADDGYTNYIDLTIGKGSNWYYYYDTAARASENRGLMVGDTYDDVMGNFGYSVLNTVETNDSYKQYFDTSNMPRTYLEYKYRENQKDYYKRFYFDGNNNLVLIIWYM